MNKKIIAIMTVTMMVVLCLGIITEGSSADGTCTVLIDSGNGETNWCTVDINGSESISDIFKKAAEGVGMTYSYSAGVLSINGLSEDTIGAASTGGSFVISGTTGVTVTSTWRLYLWNTTTSEWDNTPVANITNPYVSGTYAIGFYPSGITPVETPDCKESWTMVRGDAHQSGNQTTEQTTTEAATVKWMGLRNVNQAGVYCAVLYANNLVFVKFGTGVGMAAGMIGELCCYDMEGNVQWTFDYPGIEFYETSTPLIAGDYIYLNSGLGYIFKLPWKEGPGVDNVNVTTFNGAAYDEEAVKEKIGAIPYSTGATLTGTTYSTGPGSLIFDSGCIFFECSNGMVYCFNTDLEMIWSYQMAGSTYYNSPTVYDNYVFTGALNGHLYINNKRTGALISDEHIYTRTIYDKTYGSVNNAAVFKTEENAYTIFASFTDGRGMSSVVGGLARLTFNGNKVLTKDVDDKTYGMLTNYILPAKVGDFTGVYFTASSGFYRVDLNGKYFNLNSGVLPDIHAPATLVNNSKIYVTAYTAGKDNFILDTDGKILSQMAKPERVNNYGMSPATIIGDYVFYGNDSGMYTVYGVFPDYIPPEPGTEKPWWETALVVLIVIVVILAVIWLVLRFVAKKERPFHYLGGLVTHYLVSDDYTHNTKSKHRLWIILIGGTAVLLIMFFISLCLGSSDILSPGDAISALFSAIGKGGQDLSYNETLVYSSRFPRALAAVAVGIGLSIAGSIYQAIIRNPLVDPYIMGISSGAGTAAIAVIAFDFTLFGLFSPHSPYLVAVTAMIGGLIAYACTTIIAQKAGGTSINYVLAGVVVGLAFSAVQTVMMSMAGHKVTNVLTWLFGSFANVSWTQLWLIVIPALALALAPLIWAKEFNLVLLGEDQAKQMGLNVRIFTIAMLTLASVLTSVCVAFVGVIGFVGLVVPHLCRMFIGGDHRLVMPTSIVIGGILMLLADLAARMVYYGQELPVGAITTIIGVPVFAWLLIKRGRMYDG